MDEVIAKRTRRPNHQVNLNQKNKMKVNKCRVGGLQSLHSKLEKEYILKFLHVCFQLKDYFHHQCQHQPWLRPCLHGDGPSGFRLIWLRPLANLALEKVQQLRSPKPTCLINRVNMLLKFWMPKYRVDLVRFTTAMWCRTKQGTGFTSS